MFMTCGLIVPVFNVENTIELVLNALTPQLCEKINEILIIDNCSTDRTLDLIKQWMQTNSEVSSKISLIQNKENYGYGCSIKTGFEYFLNSHVTHIMVIHGDYQVDPAWLISRYFNALNTEPNPDLVLASRFTPDSDIDRYSLLRRFGNYFFNVMTFLCTGLRMSDSGTAMIVVKRNVLSQIPVTFLSNTWQFHPQLNILLYSDKSLTIKEIPMNWADSAAPSSVALFRYGFTLLKMLLAYGWARGVLHKRPNQIFQHQPIRSDRSFTLKRMELGHCNDQSF